MKYRPAIGSTARARTFRANATEAELDENRSLYLMDYNTPLSDPNDAIGIYAPTPDELAQRDVARLKWSPEKAPLAKTANHLVICDEQTFTMQRGAANHFALVTQRL